MNKKKLVNLFNELSKEYYRSEMTVINEYSTNIESDIEELEERHRNIRADFLKYLGKRYEK